MEKLFNETFFKKNNYFREELNLSKERMKEIQALIKNWQKNCESFNPDVDKETTDENEFVDILFKKILGYSGKGKDADNYNILPKFKVDGASSTGKAGFADLALGNFSKSPKSPANGGSGVNAEVVIEFKGQNSDDLTKTSNRPDKLSPVDQCWKYLLNHLAAKWGIVTNFNEIRIYNKEKGQNVYETFYFNVPAEYKNKFQPLSTETEILKLITILKKENLLSANGISQTEELLKNKGVEETKVQKEFYFAYKSLRSQIFYEALKHNPQYESEKPKSELLQLVQKFLDRIIFCWFCEDSREHLIPTNILSADLIHTQIKDKYYNPQHFSIYGKVKDLFQAIDEGQAFGIDKGYNGELFKPDAALDALKLPNFLFEKIAEIGMQYDFGDENELNVNILGHIFEQSISDLEEMRVSFQELDQSPKKQEKQQVMEFAKEVDVLLHKHIEFDAKKTKRKKEGVFYTPDYITRYIVENTVGVWLKDKEAEVIKKYASLKKNKEYTILREYRDEHLSKIKILDPACGSGAFLIAAFNYLWKEHERVYTEIKEIKNKTAQGELFDFDSINKTILENNLYGVDLNRESVEITKLALWLKTAAKNKKLNSLHNNIKCGNSLIDDKTVAGELAFDWKERFPYIFDKKIIKKNLQAYHIVWVTNKSRFSKKLFDVDYSSSSVKLSPDERKTISEAIDFKIKEGKLYFRVLGCNILEDHIHLLIVCAEEDLDRIVGQLKGYSARVSNSIHRGTPSIGSRSSVNQGAVNQGVNPLVDTDTSTTDGDPEGQIRHHDGTIFKLWAKGYSHTFIKDEKLLLNTISYIQDNHLKHSADEESSATEGLTLRRSRTTSQLTGQYITQITSLNQAFEPFEESGGFDIVVGNPPYVYARDFISDDQKEYFSKIFTAYEYQPDLYILFIEKSITLMHRDGKIGLIIPNSWLGNIKTTNIRKLILNKSSISNIVYCSKETFEVNVETVIIILEQFKKNNKIKILEFDKLALIKNLGVYNQSQFDLSGNQRLNLRHFGSNVVLSKMENISNTLENYFDITRGVNAYDKYRGQSEDVIKNSAYHSETQKDNTYFPELKGKHVGRYFYNWEGDTWIKYGEWLAAPREPKYFTGDRIVLRQIPSDRLLSSLVIENFIIDQTVFIAKPLDSCPFNLKFIISLINSTLMSFYFKSKNDETDEIFPKVKIENFKSFPIAKLELSNKSQKAQYDKLVSLADIMLSKNKELQEIQKKFTTLLVSEFSTRNPALKDGAKEKLEDWYLLDWSQFAGELKKKKIVFSAKDEEKWLDRFERLRKEALAIKGVIDSTDKEIDQKVYELYGLTRDEIGIVEGK